MANRKTTAQFISEAIAVHGDKYDYSKVQYINGHTNIRIICPIHGEFTQIANTHLQAKYGCSKCARLEVDASRNRTKHHFYSKWCSMRSRCSKTGWKGKYKAYTGCSICDEWNSFNNFNEWAENPTNGYIDGYHLDKDLLVKGNKIYSPQTCCFIPHEINSMLTNCKKRRGAYPIGVSKNRNVYCVTLSRYSNVSCIGTFNTPEEAFNAYKIAKEQHIKELANKYFKEGKMTQRVYDALMKYEVEIID